MRFLLPIPLLLAACSQPVAPGPSTSSTPAGPPSGASDATRPAPAASSAAVFDVHEWGLVDVAGTNARLLAGPPQGPTNWNAPRRKPVLYFHLEGDAKLEDVSVKVRSPAPGVVEHYPTAALSDDRTTLEWKGLQVRKGSCPVGTMPSREAPACKTSDGICELVELPRYETADSSCVRTGARDYNHLFYRSGGPAPQLPFDVTPKGASLVISHARASDVIGSILWVHNEGGAVTVSLITPPALGAQLEAPPPKERDVASAQKALDATMREAGLTDAEIQAFDRAWSNDLFGNAAAARDAPARRASPAPQDYLLFALPASLMNGASEVTITPPPRSLKRFMLVRWTV